MPGAQGALRDSAKNPFRPAVRPSALLMPHLGLIDAMTAMGMLSVGGITSGPYLWGCALHGRLARIEGALAVGMLIPMVILSRVQIFYPEMTAVFTISAALACARRSRAHASHPCPGGLRSGALPADGPVRPELCALLTGTVRFCRTLRALAGLTGPAVDPRGGHLGQLEAVGLRVPAHSPLPGGSGLAAASALGA